MLRVTLAILSACALVASSTRACAHDANDLEPLGARALPFAKYIVAMHRQIHKKWTFGFISYLDHRDGKGPFDDKTLWTQLQIAVNADGTIDKVGVVRQSGNMAFDWAAIDSVRSASPYPIPPSMLASADGKVYMDWQFHRDERACGTFGVDPYIFTKPGVKVAHETNEAGPQHERGPTVVPAITDKVRAAAEGWFSAWKRGDVAWLAGWSAVPFLASLQVAKRATCSLPSLRPAVSASASY